MVNFLLGFGEVVADVEDVYTNRFTLGSLAAEFEDSSEPCKDFKNHVV